MKARLCLLELEDRIVPAVLNVGANEPFHTIQSAVTAAQAGDTIQIDPGTYVESVSVNNVGHSRNGIAIIGTSTKFNTVNVKLPAGAPSVIDVTGTQNVLLEYLTVEGPSGTVNNGGSLYGIKIDGGGSATIQFNRITAIQDTPFGGVQEGIAIQVGRQIEGQTGTATIFMNTIDNYQKAGIAVDNNGSSATILNNTITGVGPTSVTAQNGIQVSRGATATVNFNTISGNIYIPQTVAATGILLFNPGKVDVESNTVTSNDVGIDDISAATGSTISGNTISQSTFDGIDLDGTTGTTVSNNQISNSGFDGISLFDTSVNNIIQNNTVSFSGHDGIIVEAGSTGNQFLINHLSASGHLDAEDLSTGTGTAGTGNTWTGNTGTTSSPAGLVGTKGK